MRMRGTIVVAIVGALLTTSAVAQDFTPTPTPLAKPAPPPEDVQLLDEVPDYAAVLVHQWRSGVPQDVIEAARSSKTYGRLSETGPTHPLSLAEAIALAVQNNTSLQIERLGPVGAQTQVRGAWAAFDPVVFGDISRDRTTTPAGSVSIFTSGGGTSVFTQNLTADAGIRKMLLSGGQLSLEWTNNRLVTNPSVINQLVPEYTTSLGLSLDQPLLRDFGWRYSLLMVEVAQTTAQEAYYQYKASIASLVTQVEQAYWSLVLAVESVRVQEQGVALAKEVQRQNEGKFNVGALPQTAVLEAKSEVARRDAILIQAQNFRDVARDNLRAIINYRSPEASALLLVEASDKPTVTPYDINLEHSLKTAQEQRPELVAARLDVQGRGLERKVAENQLLPKLNFVGQIGVNGLSGNGVPSTSPTPFSVPNPAVTGGYGRALELLPDGRYYSYSAGATIEIPLGNAQAKADYAQSKVNFEQSRLSLQKLQEDVTLEIKTAVSNLTTDLKSIDATRIARELAEENLRNQQARYDVGLATTKDLLDFQNQLTQARFAEIQSLTKYNTDLAEMRRVDGTLLSARNILIERVSPETAPWWAQF